MLNLPSIPFLWRAFTDVCRRFPAAILCVAIGSIALLWVIQLEAVAYENRPKEFMNDLVTTWMVALLGLSIFVGLRAMSEQRQWSQFLHLGITALVATALILYWNTLDVENRHFERYDLPCYFGLLVAAHLFAATAPYLNQLSVADFWTYNKELFGNIIVSCVYTLVLFAGLSFAILAVNELFDLHINSRIYPQLFVLLAGFFNTTYFLFHFPKGYIFQESDRRYNAALHNLCKYILIPISILYFLILYAYSLKILATWDLPKGWVSSLIIGFSIAGILTWLLNYRLPFFDQGSIVRFYHRWFWPVLLPMVVLLFIAIGRRISDYGVTEGRFLVAHTGAWLLLCGAYYIISRKDNIKFIPISLAIFTLGALFGPFNMFNVSERSQLGVFKQLLNDAGRLSDGQAKPGTALLRGDTAARIYSVLYYLENRDRLSLLQPLFAQPLDSLNRSTASSTGIANWLKVSPEDSYGSFMDNVHVSASQDAYNVIPIAGYDYAMPVSIYSDSTSISYLREDSPNLMLGASQSLLRDTFSLELFLENAYKEKENNSYYLPQGEASVPLEGKLYTGNLVVHNLQFTKKENGYSIRQIDGMLLLKKREKR
jgi:hypothetical protein